MDYPWVYSGSTSLSIRNDIIQVRTSDLDLQLPIDTVQRCTFLAAADRQTPGYIRFATSQQTSVTACFNQPEQEEFRAVYQAVSRRIEELKQDQAIPFLIKAETAEQKNTSVLSDRPWLKWILIAAILILILLLWAALAADTAQDSAVLLPHTILTQEKAS